MDLHTAFLFIFTIIIISVFILVAWTIYEFHNLDHEQFGFYIIGLLFYGISILCFFFRYVVLTPLTGLENFVLGYTSIISSLIGLFCFIKNTENLAKKEKPDFVRNERLYNLVFYLFIIMGMYTLPVYVSALIFDKNIFEILSAITVVFFLIIMFFALKLFFEYKQAFVYPMNRIIYLYILAVVLLIIGGLIITQALVPIATGDHTFTDLSYLRNGFSIIGAFVVLIPFIICYKSVSKFRKLLSG